MHFYGWVICPQALSGQCTWRPYCLVNNLMCRPAPVAQWLASRTAGRKVWGSNPIRVMWDFSALAGSYPELGLLWAQWEGWNHTAALHPLRSRMRYISLWGCCSNYFSHANTAGTAEVPQFQGLGNTGIIMTLSVVCGPVWGAMRNEPWVWVKVGDAGTSGAGAVPLRSAQVGKRKQKRQLMWLLQPINSRCPGRELDLLQQFHLKLFYGRHKICDRSSELAWCGVISFLRSKRSGSEIAAGQIWTCHM